MVLLAHVTFTTSGTSAERAASVPLWAVRYAMADVHPCTQWVLTALPLRAAVAPQLEAVALCGGSAVNTQHVT